MDEKGEPWFVVNDMVFAFNTTRENLRQKMHRHLGEDERTQVRLGGIRGLQPHALVSESGLYKLVMRSDKPQARAFQDWVTKDVLPAIRKDGAYVMGEEKVRTGEMSEEEFILKAMTIMQAKTERLKKELSTANTQKEHLAGIVEEHLVHLTIDEWRALNGQYFTSEDFYG